jgi:hypothetical protein
MSMTSQALDTVGLAWRIYESSLRAGPGWRESLYRHQGCCEASDCGRLGRQAAGQKWQRYSIWWIGSMRRTI